MKSNVLIFSSFSLAFLLTGCKIETSDKPVVTEKKVSVNYENHLAVPAKDLDKFKISNIEIWAPDYRSSIDFYGKNVLKLKARFFIDLDDYPRSNYYSNDAILDVPAIPQTVEFFLVGSNEKGGLWHFKKMKADKKLFESNKKNTAKIFNRYYYSTQKKENPKLEIYDLRPFSPSDYPTKIFESIKMKTCDFNGQIPQSRAFNAYEWSGLLTCKFSIDGRDVEASSAPMKFEYDGNSIKGYVVSRGVN